MFKTRLINVLIFAALILALALTVQEAVATTALKSGAEAAVSCDSLPSRYSIRSEYVREADMWILRTEDGPTGVDGGLIELLSGHRTCSR